MTTVLALTSNTPQRDFLARALAESQLELIFTVEPLPADRMIDIVVNWTDNPLPASLSEDSRYIAGLTAVVAIGNRYSADTVLPQDATAREIALACQLLSEIVKLRGQRSEFLRSRSQLHDLAYTDPLTGIANRRSWSEELTRRAAESWDPKVRWGLAILDLDRFKEINDRYGHKTGDDVLKCAAHAIAAGVRLVDFAARLGGDEFGLLLADVDSADTACVVERIRRGVATRCSSPAGPNVAASAGFALFQENDTCDTLFERADSALRRAKEMGRDRTVGA